MYIVHLADGLNQLTFIKAFGILQDAIAHRESLIEADEKADRFFQYEITFVKECRDDGFVTRDELKW